MGRRRAPGRPALFDSGTAVGLSDGELLGRFADRPGRDEAAGPAFAALVERHGPMVLRVCRSVLRDEHDAQDAFQATFLVLVRRAAAVRRQESVGSWLHGVALRVSARARADMARRRRHERCAVEERGTADQSGAGGIAPELAAILHEELGRLPERYRAAVVLCYLEGHTCEAAARRLGWPVGTVKSRLARGRERLRGRLIRRGLAPDEASESPTAPAVIIPAALARTTAEAMLRFASGRPIAGTISATALSWTHQTLRTMQMTRLAMISALLIAGLAATGVAMFAAQERAARLRLDRPRRRRRRPRSPNRPSRRCAEKPVEIAQRAGGRYPGPGRAGRRGQGRRVRRHARGRRARISHRCLSHRRRRPRPDRRRSAPSSTAARLQSRPDDRTIGWASLPSDQAWPKANDERSDHADPALPESSGRGHGREHPRAADPRRPGPRGPVQSRSQRFSDRYR